jgi:hypothetical protein
MGVQFARFYAFRDAISCKVFAAGTKWKNEIVAGYRSPVTPRKESWKRIRALVCNDQFP